MWRTERWSGTRGSEIFGKWKTMRSGDWQGIQLHAKLARNIVYCINLQASFLVHEHRVRFASVLVTPPQRLGTPLYSLFGVA